LINVYAIIGRFKLTLMAFLGTGNSFILIGKLIF